MGRGNSGKAYGTEFETLYQVDNIKFVRYKDASSATAPQVTKTSNRIYAVVNAKDEVKFVVFFDEENKRSKQIDVAGQSHFVDGKKLDPPHTHQGYNHDEGGTRELNDDEKAVLEKVQREWYNHIGR